ncbi:MAG: response regulator [Candidatus Dormibacteraeota bacterium]|nr:response regulator [Candidatus Dormibacteraeota bacterium]
MSGLQNFLTPYSHLIFANRDKVIVVLALVLGWVVIQLLVARWRTERLERDLIAARANPSHAPSRARHVAAPIVEEAPAEAGGLPPIKGGRSYARNLGSALQKAGIPSGPQLYSPPVPQGWNPNTGNGQPNPAAPPMQPPTYAPPPSPWGAPPAQPGAPWAYPAGANRPPFPSQPMGPTPTPYAPAAPGAFSGNQGQPLPAGYPSVAPGQFPQPFQPAGAGPDSGRQAPEASFSAAPTPPSAPPVVVPPSPDVQPEDSGSKDGRRGKPKRRRFNLSVLDNLEKIVQSKAPEAPPAASAAPAAQPVVPIAMPLPTPAPQPLFTPAQAAAPTPADPPIVETPGLFDQVEPEVAAQELEPAVVVEAPRSSRPQMRSMLFGEEPALEAEPVAEASATEEAVIPETPEAVEAEAAPEPEPVAEVVEPSAPETQETVAVSEPAESRGWPWAKRAPQREAEAEAPVEPVAEVPIEAAVAEAEPTAEPEPEPEPMLVESEPIAAEPPAEDARVTGSAGVLVIIEDDKVAADYYATLFRGNGYQVDIANDGVSGVDLCVRLQPQVILLDVMMPRQNGILVLQTLRASDETRNTPVVVMSNFSEPTLIKRALQLGALEYVIKTQVEGPALLNAIPHWMNREKAFAA